MQVNFLKKVVENAAGEQAVKIVELLYNKKDINEFLIAKKLKLTINQTRNLLYKLSNLGIISSTRKKDKRKGWYIYFWTFNVLKSLNVLESGLKNEIIQLQAQLNNKKTKRFYKCKLCGRDVNEETALLTDFICSECGEVYSLADNTQAIEELSKKINKLQKEIDSVRNEIRIEEEKIAANVHRKDRKLKKLKLMERRKKMKKLKRLKKKLLRKIKKKQKKKKLKLKKSKKVKKTKKKKSGKKTKKKPAKKRKKKAKSKKKKK